MRGIRHGGGEPTVPKLPDEQRNDLQTLAVLLPYLWAYKGRVLFAVACLVAAKVAIVGVPVLLKHIVDAFITQTGTINTTTLAAVPLALIVAYGLLRISTSVFTELREFFFAKVTQAAVHT